MGRPDHFPSRFLTAIIDSKILNHPALRRYTALVREDLSQTYSRDIQKWLLIAPIIGVISGLAISAIAMLILDTIWIRVLPYYLAHHWAILAGIIGGFVLTGIIMTLCTNNPNLHSTEEIVRSYHEHRGDIDMRPFFWKLLAAVTTVGSGGSAALEGPSIYGGGAIGSWLWTKLRRFGLESRDRRIMLISGAGAGMAAVFRAPLTGLVFALEMPYKDDLAHEALLPSLIASVVSYATLVSIVGAQPLFSFGSSGAKFQSVDVFWSALLGLVIGIVSIFYDITFRRVRSYFIAAPVPHVAKLLVGGVGTALCGVAFITLYPGDLIPVGPNYEAVREILSRPLPTELLLTFAAFKLGATIFSLGSGGVSAMFVPVLLAGGCIGSAFAQSVVHTSALDLYAAVGMAAFIAGGYKAPMTAVVFVAETTGHHSFLMPSLIGAAVAYAVSGEASVSGDQRLHEMARLAELSGMKVADVMQRRVVGVAAETTVAAFAAGIARNHAHTFFPVLDGEKACGLVSMAALARIAPDRWSDTTIGQVAEHELTTVGPDCDLMEALRLLVREDRPQMLIVVDDERSGRIQGIVTKSDLLRGLEATPSHRE